MRDFERLANEYDELFGEAIPIYGIAYESEEELLNIIKKAIEDGEPIKPRYSDDRNVLY